MTAKFKQADDRRKSPEQTDETGTVVVSVMLCEKGHRPVKGNVIRKIRLADAKVSEVFEAIIESIIE